MTLFCLEQGGQQDQLSLFRDTPELTEIKFKEAHIPLLLTPVLHSLSKAVHSRYSFLASGVLSVLLLSLPPALSREKAPGGVTKPRQHYQPSQAQFMSQKKREGRIFMCSSENIISHTLFCSENWGYLLLCLRITDSYQFFCKLSTCQKLLIQRALPQVRAAPSFPVSLFCSNSHLLLRGFLLICKRGWAVSYMFT